MPSIIKSYVTQNSRYKAAEPLNPIGVILHSIGCPQPKAKVLHDNWAANSSPYCTHYVLDDTEIYHCMPHYYKCWHIGSPGNSKYIGIEMGEPKQIKYKTGATFDITDITAAQAYVEKCYKNAVWLIAKLCKEFGWNPQTAIYTHNEITVKGMSMTDHVDPEHLWNGLGMGYDLYRLRKDVAAAMGSAAVEPTVEPTQKDENQIYRIRKSWDDAASQIGAYTIYDNAVAACVDGYAVFDSNGKQLYPAPSYAVRITATSLNVRKEPNTKAPIMNMISYGGVYTIVDEENGWGLLKAYAAQRNGWVSLKYTERV